MDFTLDPELEDFRQMVRSAIQEDLPDDMRDRVRKFGAFQAEPHDQLKWMQIMHKRGWSVPHWPEEHGGLGWSPMQLYIFEEEVWNAWAPGPCWSATAMCGPVIYTFGSDYVKEKFLPDFREGKYFLAQGFSEPSAGSDLAHLRTKAERNGDKYIVNGQKIWTSSGYASDWGFFLVRTNQDVKPQAGISFLMIDMKSPGITVRRIPQLNGEADLCEVFLDNVEVPVENLIGEEGQGWTYGKFLLDHERTASSFIFYNKRELARAKWIAEQETLDGVPLAQIPSFQSRIARLEAEVTALQWSVMRELAKEEFKYNSTAAASTLKIAGSQLQQAIPELEMDLLGVKATRYFPFYVEDREETPPLWPDYVPGRSANGLLSRCTTIYGGSLQVQRGLISKLAFGL